MLHESAAPLARLYAPLLKCDDTFILQEYFIPREQFRTFITDLKDVIMTRVHKTIESGDSSVKKAAAAAGGSTLMTLLNITIRFVQPDTDSALPYATHPSGVYAFVLYYRIRRTAEADAALQQCHSLLADAALRLGGTFYLPYRHHYSDEQLHRAYPSFKHFCAQKHRFDPTGMFGNLWWDRYGTKATTRALTLQPKTAAPDTLPPAAAAAPSTPVTSVSIRRSDSFRKLLANPVLREQFLDGFLMDIFAIVPQKEMYRLVTTAAWDARKQNDDDIYGALLESLSKRNTPFTQLTSLWSQVKQLSDQKRELVRETVSVLARLGRVGHVHDYCSIGDHGKLILPLRKAVGMRGRAWIVHDELGNESNIAAVLERAAVNSVDVGEYVSIDYRAIRADGREFGKIPDSSCDLVTLNQGLHHLLPEQLSYFLAAVYRVLRPGALFIIREHDLDTHKHPHLLPMLDCAHMVFNAGTGVPLQMERDEIRGFRSNAEWRVILERAGFRDTLV